MFWIVYRGFGCVMGCSFPVSIGDRVREKMGFVIRYFIGTERNQVDEFFTQSSLTTKPVVSEINDEIISETVQCFSDEN